MQALVGFIDLFHVSLLLTKVVEILDLKILARTLFLLWKSITLRGPCFYHPTYNWRP